MDEDLARLTREQLIAEVKRLRAGIRAHRDASGHELCWHHPQLWGLLPEPIPKNVAVPDWSAFMRGCIKYRESLDRELPAAPRTKAEFNPVLEGDRPKEEFNPSLERLGHDSTDPALSARVRSVWGK